MSLVLAIVNVWRPCLSHLQEVKDFGTNPGALRMLTYLPDNRSPRPALVVVLHGSMQSATDYDLGAGWSTLADRYGFALLMPEQSLSIGSSAMTLSAGKARHIRLRKWSSKWCTTTTSIGGGSS